jgi:hypothetical protein
MSVVHEVTYYKRFRMEVDLQDPLPEAVLPAGFSWVAWDPSLLRAHADVKFRSFYDQVDAIVFPSLGSRVGCYHLMREISRKPGFHGDSTWLIACAEGYCGTVQGIRERRGVGSIQNLGVSPPYQGRGLGSALLLQSLHGFRKSGRTSR